MTGFSRVIIRKAAGNVMEVAVQVVNLYLASRVIKAPDVTINHQKKCVTNEVDKRTFKQMPAISDKKTNISAMVKKPPNILDVDVLGKAHDDRIHMDPPPVKLKKPPEKVDWIIIAVVFVVKKSVPLRDIVKSTVDLKFSMWGSVLTVKSNNCTACEDDIGELQLQHCLVT